MSHPPQNRRQALARMLAWASMGALVTVEPATSRLGATTWQPESFADLLTTTEIVPGERVGGLWLDMSEREVVQLLGQPEERQVHEGHSLEEMRAVLEVVNSQLGTDLKAEDYPDPPSVYLCYHEQGLATCLRESRVRSLFVYTGFLSGYQTGIFRGFFGDISADCSLEMIANLHDVWTRFGSPRDQLEMTSAPIPSRTLYYDGISFDGNAETGRISHLTITPRKSQLG